MANDIREDVDKIKRRVLEYYDFAAMTDEELDEAVMKCIEEEYRDQYID